MPYGGETPSEVMRKHVDLNVAIVPPDHLNTNLSGGLGMVVETMMAKNREHRYHTPDDLILDLKCLLRDESPMIAGQKPETLQARRRGIRLPLLPAGCQRRTDARDGFLRQQSQSHHRHDGDDPGGLGDHERHPPRRRALRQRVARHATGADARSIRS